MESPNSEDDLWLAVGEDVNPNRPVFTGDVFDEVIVAGQDQAGEAIVVAHPCSIRGRNGKLGERVLMAPIGPYQALPLEKWLDGHFGIFPLAGLPGDPRAASLDDLGSARTADLESAHRVACLSVMGINLLQQRLVMRLTRAGIPTVTFHQAFSHTYEEADLLEEWTDTLVNVGFGVIDAASLFEKTVRTEREDGSSMQGDLRDPQKRAAVRRELRELAQQARP